MKKFKLQAFEAGKQGFLNGYSSTPHANEEFIKSIPNGSFFSNDCYKIRSAMYKAYSKGWTISMLAVA